MATRIGIGMEELTSLSCFLDPAVSRRILEAYWQKSGEEPSIFMIKLAILFAGLARTANCLSPDKLEELDDMRADLEHELPPKRWTPLLRRRRETTESRGLWGFQGLA